MATKKPVGQQEFLRNAMAQLNMTPAQFAERIGTSQERLDSWLLPPEATGFRDMDEIAWRFIREILEVPPKAA